MKNSEIILHALCVEQGYLTESEFKNLTEETQIDALAQLASSILKTINSKLSASELSVIDRSKGDIKQFKSFNSVVSVLNNLEALIDRASEKINPEIRAEISTIGKAILYLNQYSPQFKDAYRNKKTLLVLKYQSIVLSIISAVSYLMSVLVDFSGDNITLTFNPKFEVIAPIRALENFVRSAESGELRTIFKDVQVMRESYNECQNLDEGVMNVLDTVANGIKNIISNLEGNGKLVNVIYTAAGVVVLILSIREVFYMLGNMKLKVNDMLASINSFADIGSLTSVAINKLNKFTGQCKIESEFGSEMAEREISSEDRSVSAFMTPTAIKQQEVPTDVSDFGGLFDF